MLEKSKKTTHELEKAYEESKKRTQKQFQLNEWIFERYKK